MTRSVLAPVVAALLAPAGIALAADPPPRPGELRLDPRHDVSRIFDALMREVAAVPAAHGGRTEPLTVRLVEVLAPRVDWEEVSRRTLSGPTWDQLGAKKRARFEKVWRDWILAWHLAPLEPGDLHHLELAAPTEYRTEEDAVVPVRLLDPEGRARDLRLRVRWSAHGGDRRWRLVDVVEDGLSRVQTWRAGMRPLYRQKGFDVLVKDVERRTASIRPPPA